MERIDKILNQFGITYQRFIKLNNYNIKDIIKEGNIIKIDDTRNDRNIKDNIQKIYQDSFDKNNDEENIICPYCKNIITIPKQ